MIRNSIRLLAGVATLATTMLVWPSSGVAGGGCGPVVPSTTGVAAGTATVGIEGCAFGPAILEVPLGEEVTFVNRDHRPHAVTGAGWGDTTLIENGRSVEYRFDRLGIHPFQCYLHPGMVGAIVVVGDSPNEGTSVPVSGEPTSPADLSVVAVAGSRWPPSRVSLPAVVVSEAGVSVGRPRGGQPGD